MEFWATEYVKIANDIGEPESYTSSIARNAGIGGLAGAGLGALAGGIGGAMSNVNPRAHILPGMGAGAALGAVSGLLGGGLAGGLLARDQRHAVVQQQAFASMPPEQQDRVRQLYQLSTQNVPLSPSAVIELRPHKAYLEREHLAALGLPR